MVAVRGIIAVMELYQYLEPNGWEDQRLIELAVIPIAVTHRVISIYYPNHFLISPRKHNSYIGHG